MVIQQQIKQKIMRNSRDKKIEHFYSLCPFPCKLLDVGVSKENDMTLSLARNYFLKNFKCSDECYTGLGVQDLSAMTNIFPGKKFVQYAGGRFPFNDKEFEWVYCNAVIEHVGDVDKQLFFVNEMLRVSKNVFFTTPNKYFPVETHTNLLFLHWSDRLFMRHCESKSKEKINLLTYQQLNQIIKKSNAVDFSIVRNRMFGLTMTFSVVCK